MAIIATLGVSVVARTKKFRSGLNKATKNLQAFGKTVTRMSLNVVKFGAALSIAGAVGLGVFINRSLKAIDEAGKLSDILNISTENLLAFRLQAELAGGSVAGFDKLLGIFVRRLGEAQEGTGEAANTLERLGLNIEDLVNLDTAEALGIVTDEINKLGSAAAINAARYQIFGRQGITAGNQLAQGSEGLRKARIEADKLGITVNRFDAAKIEEANDSFTRLEFLLQGVGNQLAILASPFITAVNDRLVELGTTGEKTLGEKIVNGVEKAVKGVAEFIEFVNKLTASFQLLFGITLQGLALVQTELFRSTIVIAKFFGIVFKGAKKFAKDLENRIRETGRLADQFIGDSIKRFQDIAGRDIAGEITKAFDDIRRKADESAESIINNAKAAKKLKGSLPGEMDIPKPPGRLTFGREIDLTRTAISGIAGIRKGQTVTDPQLQMTNSLLSEINRKLGGPTLAVAS